MSDAHAAFEIALGTYEEFLLGYKFSKKDCKITQTFACHDHTASVRCVDVCDNLMATGGADDRIYVYDLKTRQEHRVLTHSNATVNCLRFTPAHSHLISGTDDGSISIVRAGNWQLEKVWNKAHKCAAILDIGVHPSGKLALSLGADCALRTWNLVKGRQAYVVNLSSKSKDAKSLVGVRWALDGVRFVLFGGKYTEIWSIETGGILLSVTHENKIASCLWLSEVELLVGYEIGRLGMVSTENGTIDTKDAHKGRIKAMSLYEDCIVTICSDGEFKVWSKLLVELVKFDTGCRLTCVTIIPLLQVKKEEQLNELAIDTEVNNVNEDDTSNAKHLKMRQVVVENDDDKESEISVKKKKQKRIENNENPVKCNTKAKRTKNRKPINAGKRNNMSKNKLKG